MIPNRLFIIILFLIPNFCTADNATLDRKFKHNLCIGAKFAQGQPLSHLEYLKELGVTWVREEISWPKMEPRKGVYKPFPKSMQTRLQFYKNHDIGVIFIVAYENARAYPNDIVNEFAYGRYAAYIARQLKKSGVRFVIEIWNEPHNSKFAKKEHYGGRWNGAPPSPWLDQYIKMVHQAVKKVKAVDPKIKVITDDDMWIVHYHFLEKGLPEALDGFAVHPYVQKPPEIAAIKHNTHWTWPYQVVDKDQSFESAVRRLKEQGKKKMDKSPSIWITEWGWRIGINPNKPKRKNIWSASKVAQFLPRAFILAESASVETTCWFSFQDRTDGPFGLLTNDGIQRPAYSAFVSLNKALGESKFQCELNTNSNGHSTKRSFLFKDDKGSITASWDTSGKSFYDRSVKYERVSSQNFRLNCIK